MPSAHWARFFFPVHGWDTVCWQGLSAGCRTARAGLPGCGGEEKWGEDRTERLHFRGVLPVPSYPTTRRAVQQQRHLRSGAAALGCNLQCTTDVR